MDATAKKFADDARLYRQAGHPKQSAQLIQYAKKQFPAEPCLEVEEKKLKRARLGHLSRKGAPFIKLVDRLGLPVFFTLMAAVAWLLGPIILIKAG